MKRVAGAQILAALLCTLLIVGLFASGAKAADTVMFSDGFESALTGWTISGKASWYSGPPVIGTHGVKLQKNAAIQRTVSTVGWQDITVSFWLGASVKRAGAALQALWFDGVTWTTVKAIGTGDADADGALHYYEFLLPAGAANSSKFALRFKLSTRSPNDVGYVDNVAVRAASRFMYPLNLSGPNGLVKVNGIVQSLPWSGAFEYGSSVVLQAVPDAGYHFTGWSGALTGSTNPTTILMDAGKDVTANFTPDSYQLAIGSGTGHGSIKVDGVLYALPWVGAYERGATVLLEAVPDTGYHFTGWAGGLGGDTNPEFITMNSNQSVSAGFASDTYVLHLSSVGSGGAKVNGVYHALPDTIEVAHGSTVTLESAPDTGWHFTGWSGDLSGTTDPTFLLMGSDKRVTVSFALDQYDMNLSATGNGSVKVDGADHAFPWSGVYSYGDIVTLEAVPAAGSHFSSWSGDLTGSANPTVVVVDGSKDIAAGFALNTYTLTLAGTNGTVKVNGAPKALPWSGPFAAGEVVNLEAVPSDGYHFVAWSGADDQNNPTAITMDGDRVVVAEFAVNSCTLTVSGTHGSLNVDGLPQALPYSASFDYGAVVSLEAVPDPGYAFAGWSGDLTGTTNPADVTLFGDATIAASFSVGGYTLSLSGTGGAVKVNGVAQTLPWSGQYDYGTSVTLEPTPDQCMRFSGWSGDLSGWDNPGTVVMTSSASITVEFSSIEIFSDVGCDVWGAREVAACVEAGIVMGFSDGNYQPTLPVTRDQMAVYVARALSGGDSQVPTAPATVTFPDVPVGYWAFKYVEYARAENIITGYPDGFYRPEVALDRGQMAVFIARAAAAPADRPDLISYTPPASPTFADVTPDNDWSWAYKHVEYIVGNGVARGYPDGLYHPEVTCTRDQMAVYIQRAFKLPI